MREKSGVEYMEMWDIYNSEKQLTGRQMKKNDFHMKEGDFHLTVLGLIRRSDGSYLITQRVMTKAWAPGHWEVSGGGVQAGETSEEAIRREILEETGLDVGRAAGGYLFSYQRINPSEGDNYFVDIYRFTMDFAEEDVCLQTEEAMAWRLARAEEIRALGEEGLFLHYDSIKEAFI